MAQDPLLALATDRELSGRPTRVLLYLCAMLEFENTLPVSITETAKALSLDKGDVSRCMSLLVSKGILIKGDKTGNVTSYRLNPNLWLEG